MTRRNPSWWLFALGIAIALPARAETSAETDVLQLRFSDRGELLELTACYPGCREANARRITLGPAPAVVSFEQTEGGRWSAVERTGVRERVLEFSGSDGRLVRWHLPESGYGVGLVTEGVGALTLQSGDGLQPAPAAGFGNWLERVRYVVVDAKEVRQFDLEGEPAGDTEGLWGGIRSRFWAVLVSAESESRFQFARAEDSTPPAIVRTGQEETAQLLLYFGPVEPGELAAVDSLLGNLMYAGLWFWLRWICIGLFYLLDILHDWVPAWGLAIMTLSIAVNLLMSPLSHLADRLQQQVHATEARLAPELARIKQTSRGEEQAERILALYRAENVHPLYSLKSLLGVAIVIPVFIGAFDMLAENIHLQNVPFLWIRDLSRPDAAASLPFELPFLGAQLNLLPFLMTGLSILAAMLHRPRQQHPDLRRRQLRNMTGLAVAFFVLFYTFPAGMVLYWTTNNLIAVGKGLRERLRPGGPLPDRRAST